MRHYSGKTLEGYPNLCNTFLEDLLRYLWLTLGSSSPQPVLGELDYDAGGDVGKDFL